jgi:hypothetical protein
MLSVPSLRFGALETQRPPHPFATIPGVEIRGLRIAQDSASRTYEFAVAGFALLVLLAAQWTLSSIIHGTNYDGVDGKIAQATVLAAVKFSTAFQITMLSPVQGVGSQLLPLNVWANPAYWPFHFLDKALASDVSALIALMMFAAACYVMARCFEVGIIASVIAAQSCIVLFAPTVLVLQLPTVFCINPGNAVAYAPHMVALGLLARIELGSWRRIALITAVIFSLIFYSLYCDPLWTMVDGISWAVAFAVVVLCPLHLWTIALRAGALACCGVVLFLTGALEYLRTLSQYTARVQFPAVADRPRMVEFVSSAFISPSTKYFYLASAVGWFLGIVLLRGRPRAFCVAAVVTFLCYVGYATGYLLLEGAPWVPPIPTYVEQSVLPLYLAAGVVGYWGAIRAATHRSMDPLLQLASVRFHGFLQQLRSCLHLMVQRTRIAAIHLGKLRFARSLLPLSRLLAPHVPPPASSVALGVARPGIRFVFLAAGLIAVGVIPAALARFAKHHSSEYADRWNEPWPNEPELVKYFESNIGRTIGRPFRGSVHFPDFIYNNNASIAALWARGVPSIFEYSQLVTPQALYFLDAVLEQNVTGDLNGFIPVPGLPRARFWKALQLLGARHFVVDEAHVERAIGNSFPDTKFSRRPISGLPGLWHSFELPHPNVGDYSPTEVRTGGSATDIAAILRETSFDFTKQVVLPGMLDESLTPAREMRLWPVRGGFHVSGKSEGTSLVVLPQQYSHCLRARDTRVRLVRANLMMTGLVFSGELNTDIVFDYGIFTPACRQADLADIKGLQLKIDRRMAHLSANRLFPGWNSSIAKLWAAVNALK